MAKSENQKQKLIRLAAFLLRETDEEHPASVEDLRRHLASFGIAAERKSLYDDMEQLRLCGLDVVCKKGKNGGYFIGEREFELSELKLLVDAVQSSRFLTKKKSQRLIEKLQGLASRYDGKDLANTVYAANRVKAPNERIYLSIHEINGAIREDARLRFQYFEWDMEGNRVFRKNGAFYTVSPYHLIWDDENYYLVAWDGKRGEKRHYRVDKMTQVERLKKKREGKEAFADFDPALYEKKLFGMFNGREECVTLWCGEETAGVFYDRFGAQTVIRKSKDGFELSLQVMVSPLFFSFLLGFGDRVRVLGPEAVKEEYCSLLSQALRANEKN